MEAFFLGISTGWYCLASCGIYLLPFLFGEETRSKQNLFLVVLFMTGRLLVYLLLGIVTGGAGYFITENYSPLFFRISPFINLGIGLILLCGGIFRFFPSVKLCQIVKKGYKPALNALMFGVFAGLSVCPPLIAAIAGAFQSHSFYHGLLYFLFFYIGTSVYFLPLFGIKLLPDKTSTLQYIARIVMIIMALYFFEHALVVFFAYHQPMHNL